MSDMEEGDTPYKGLYCQKCGLKSPEGGVPAHCPDCKTSWPVGLVQRWPYDGGPATHSWDSRTNKSWWFEDAKTVRVLVHNGTRIAELFCGPKVDRDRILRFYSKQLPSGWRAFWGDSEKITIYVEPLAELADHEIAIFPHVTLPEIVCRPEKPPVEVGDKIDWFGRGEVEALEVQENRIRGLLTRPDGSWATVWCGKLEWVLTAKGINDGQMLTMYASSLDDADADRQKS